MIFSRTPATARAPRLRRITGGAKRRPPGPVPRGLCALAAGLLALAGCGQGASGAAGAGGSAPASRAAAENPDLDLGTSLGGQLAPDVRLVNQFGRPTSLSQFRGRVVILAFVDSQCTTVCPLTTASMVAAKALLGAAGSQVQLLGIDANPQATSVPDVLAYSRSHGMVNQWDFLTGSPAELTAAWKAYHIAVQIQQGQIDHTPALLVIDQRGREQEIYLTAMAYASIGQAGQVLAEEAAGLLPGHPRLASRQSLGYVAGLTPDARVTMRMAGSGPAGEAGGSVTLAPGRPHLVLFFATWLAETADLRAQLTGLNGYVHAARQRGLPPLTAVDEAATEPSPGAAAAYLRQLGQPLSYPVAVDADGRVGDGYGVQDQPWFVLTSASGKVIWQHDGWLPVSALEAAARRT